MALTSFSPVFQALMWILSLLITARAFADGRSATFFDQPYSVEGLDSFSRDLELSLLFYTTSDGRLLSATLDQENFSVWLQEDVLSVHLKQEELGSWPFSCNSTWIPFSLSVHSSRLVIAVKENQLLSVNLTSETVSSLLLGGPFDGCMTNISVNGVDQIFNFDTRGVLPGCSAFTPSCLLRQYQWFRWDSLTIQLQTLNLPEGGQANITLSYIYVDLPIDTPSYPLLTAHIWDSIVYSIVEGPRFGYFSKGRQVTEFSYNDVVGNRVLYQHSGAENPRDSAVIRVSVKCDGDEPIYQTEVTLKFQVEPRNDSPSELRRKELVLAVGTRALVTKEIITISDPDSNITHIHVLSVVLKQTWEENPGQLEMTNIPGAATTYLTQEKINNGNVSFQHFAWAGERPIVVNLEVKDDEDGELYTSINIRPYQGVINLTANRCLMVVEGGSQALSPSHLQSTTNFMDQNPTISYDLLTVPSYGALERRERLQWTELQVRDSFTQRDINSDRVRYVHANHSSEPDSFRFRVRSTNLTGPEAVFCVNVLSLPKVEEVTVSLDLRVDEGGEVPLRDQQLEESLSSYLNIISWFSGGSRMLVFSVVAGLGPSHGQLVVDGSPHGGFLTLDDIQQSRVEYVHSGEEEHRDSFALSWDQHESHSHLPPVRIDVGVLVRPVNDHKPVIHQSQSLNPVEGLWVVVTPDMLTVTDDDRPQENLTVIVLDTFQRGHFGFCGSEDEEVNSWVVVQRFSMGNIEEGRVVFVHHLNVSAPLNSTVSVQAVDEGGNMCNKSIEVAAIAMPVSASTSLLPGESCVTVIDALDPESDSLLQESMFALDLEDMGAITEVTVTLTSPPSHGELVMAVVGNQTGNETQTEAVDVFQWKHVLARLVRYVLLDNSAEGDVFTLDFSLGHGHSGPVSVPICVLPLPRTRLVNNALLALVKGGVATLSSLHLLAEESREEGNHTLQYTVVEGLQHGLLVHRLVETDDASILSFTQADVNAGYIQYHSTDKRVSNDSFTFVVSNGYVPAPLSSFAIELYSSKLLVHTSNFTVREGGSFALTRQQINVNAPRGFTVTIFVSHGKEPVHGTISQQLGGPMLTDFTLDDLDSGTVLYEHDDSEHDRDRFAFDVEALVASGDEGLVPEGIPHESLRSSGKLTISVQLVNDKTPEMFNNSRLEVVQMKRAYITVAHLSAHDFDDTDLDENLKYILGISRPFYGFLGLTNGNTHISTFTQGDIAHHHLYYQNTEYQPDSDEDFYSFSVTDGEWFSRSEFFYVDIVPVSYVSVGTLSIPKDNLVEGGSVTIKAQQIYFTVESDIPIADSEYSYEVTRSPQHGTLFLREEITTSFRQDDIKEEWVSYTHDHSDSQEDKFEFRVTLDSTDTSRKYTFTFHIEPIDDTPPVMELIKTPMFVVEGSSKHLGMSDLLAYDLDTTTDPDRDNLIYTIVTPPKHGVFMRERFGQGLKKDIKSFSQFEINIPNIDLYYLNTNLSHWNDSFEFTLRDSVGNVQKAVYSARLVILPLNPLSLNVTGVSVEEGGEVVLENGSFVVPHPYVSTISGEFRVRQAPRHGSLMINGTLVINGTTNTSSFTVADLLNGAVKYVHDGEEEREDWFEFCYTVMVEKHTMKTRVLRFPIRIDSVNDQPPVLQIHRPSVSLWVGEPLALDTSVFSSFDLDRPPQSLVFNYSLPEHCHMVSMRHTLSFTRAESGAGEVAVQCSREMQGSLGLWVSDGEYSDTANISLLVTPLRLAVNRNGSLELAIGGSAAITSEVLLVTSNDRLHHREVEYQVSPLHLLHGRIVLDLQQEVNSFTQTQVNEGRVSYQHTKVDYWESEDKIRLSTYTQYVRDSLLVTVNVHIRLPGNNRSELAVLAPLRVREGGHVCLSQSTLDARNVRYRTWKTYNKNFTDLSQVLLWYSFPHDPTHGSFNSSTDRITHEDIESGSVCYFHDGSESNNDSISLDIRITGYMMEGGEVELETVDERLEVFVTLINDQPPLILTPEPKKMVVEGFNATLLQSDLQVQDQDSRPADIHYTLPSQPGNGLLYMGKGQAYAFTQEQINTGKVYFMPTARGKGNCNLTYTDGNFSGNTLFVFDVVKHTLDLQGKSDMLSVPQNATSAPLVPYINTTTNGLRSETWFTVMVPPSNGKFFVASQEGSKFSQLEVDEKVVKYVPNRGVKVYEDYFELYIQNRNRSLDLKVKVRVVAWGRVKDNVELNLENFPSHRLPGDLLDLQELQRASHKPPNISILRRPLYGYLSMSYPLVVEHSYEISSFRYDDLNNEWVNYTWDPHSPFNTSAPSVLETFRVLVESPGNNPGIADISFTVIPPPQDTNESTDVPSSSSTDPSFPSTGSPDQQASFSLFALVPIIGMSTFLVIILTIGIVFCFTYRNRKPKQASGPTFHVSPHPSPSYFPHFPPVYAMERESIGEEEEEEVEEEGEEGEEDEEVMELQSHYFSDRSPPHSPLRLTQNYSSTDLQPPGRRHASNVSVNISQRFSSSDVSLGSSFTPAHRHLHSPVRQAHSPVRSLHSPVRPVHSPVRQVYSPVRPVVQRSNLSPTRQQHNMSTGDFLSQTSSRDTGFQSVPTEDIATASKQLDSASASEKHQNLEDSAAAMSINTVDNGLDHPDVRKLFRSDPPILKKQEYWV